MSAILTETLTAISEHQEIISDSFFLKLLQHQAETNSAYANYLAGFQIEPNSIEHWQDIPALPTDAFKSLNNPSSFDYKKDTTTTFYTSGTTTETKGAHHFRSTELYEASIISGWKSLGLPELHEQTLILTPPPEETPNSSLTHMMQSLKDQLCPSAEFVFSDGLLDTDLIMSICQSGKPVTLLGTALAFLQLFEELESNSQQLQLPAGSWAMETGGYKGTDKSLTKEELYQLFTEYLGINEDAIWNEYSMTELSSQFYTNGIGAPHRGPAWTRIKVINPETQQAVAPGEMGYLVIYDLANYDSCQAILTQDLAIYHDQHSFTLIGRDPSALPRGCSRSV